MFALANYCLTVADDQVRFVGLTPGILVCIGVSRWLSSIFAGRRGRIRGGKQGSLIRTLRSARTPEPFDTVLTCARNIDRILTGSTPTSNGMLSYKDHGMLLCEVHVLRKRAQRVFPGEIYNEFLEDVNDLIDLRTGVERQIQVAERIRWAYLKWLR